jgi:hypothetical protein
MRAKMEQYIVGRSKYNAIRTEIDGIKFASKKEAKVYGLLKILKAGGSVRDFRCQPRFALHSNGVKVCSYVADFEVLFPCGKIEIWDAKGMKLPIYNLKKKMMKAEHNIDIVEV